MHDEELNFSIMINAINQTDLIKSIMYSAHARSIAIHSRTKFDYTHTQVSAVNMGYIFDETLAADALS